VKSRPSKARVAGTTALLWSLAQIASVGYWRTGPRSAAQSLLERRDGVQYRREFSSKCTVWSDLFSQQSTSEDTSTEMGTTTIFEHIRLQQRQLATDNKANTSMCGSRLLTNLTGTQLLTAGALDTTGSSARALRSAGCRPR
jgi:hypothetical protein